MCDGFILGPFWGSIPPPKGQGSKSPECAQQNSCVYWISFVKGRICEHFSKVTVFVQGCSKIDGFHIVREFILSLFLNAEIKVNHCCLSKLHAEQWWKSFFKPAQTSPVKSCWFFVPVMLFELEQLSPVDAGSSGDKVYISQHDTGLFWVFKVWGDKSSNFSSALSDGRAGEQVSLCRQRRRWKWVITFSALHQIT